MIFRIFPKKFRNFSEFSPSLSVLTVTKFLRVHCLQLRIAMELIVPFTDPKEFVKETDRELLSSRIVHCFKQGGRSYP